MMLRLVPHAQTGIERPMGEQAEPGQPGAPRKGKKKDNRKWMSVPMTQAMKNAVKEKAQSLGISPTNYARMRLLEGVGYDYKTDPDLPELERALAIEKDEA